MIKKVANIGAAILACFTLYVAGFGIFDTVIVYGTFIGLGAGISLLLLDSGEHLNEEALEKFGDKPRPWRMALHIVLLIVFAVLTWRWMSVMLAQENFFIDILRGDLIGGWLAFGLIAYLTFRLFGAPMLGVLFLAVAYAVLPASLNGGDLDWASISDRLWFTTDGVFGRPFQVVATTVLIFIVYGAVLQASGAGEILLKMAFAATGRFMGGPAHAAIFASGLFGTMSGAAVANVVSTGIFTIPIIKRAGFKPKFAGAIEAAASTGGQIMPPVMGAVAFVMSDVTGIPYLQIVLAALIPALLYYVSLFLVVLVEARKHNVGAMPRSERPALTLADWIRSFSFWIPLAVIVGALLTGRTPQNAGFYALIVATLLCLFMFPKFRRPSAIWSALVSAGRTSANILMIVASVGIVIGVFNMTGVGLDFANAIRMASGGSMFFALVLVMIGCLVIGMGVPTLTAYLVLALVMGPLLESLEISTIGAHMFMLYFGVLSVITPPVALAAFAAAPIAGAKPMETGFEAVRLAIVGFVIPFLFVYHPDLLLIDGFTLQGLAWSLACFGVASWMIATGLAGFDIRQLATWERPVRLVLAILILTPQMTLSLGATALAVALVLAHWHGARKSTNTQTSPNKGVTK